MSSLLKETPDVVNGLRDYLSVECVPIGVLCGCRDSSAILGSTFEEFVFLKSTLKKIVLLESFCVVHLICVWMSCIRCRSSLCVGMYVWITVVGVMGLFNIWIILEFGILDVYDLGYFPRFLGGWS